VLIALFLPAILRLVGFLIAALICSVLPAALLIWLAVSLTH
jgi:hypothetical protein